MWILGVTRRHLFLLVFFFLMAHLTCCFSLASFNDHMCFTTNENGGCILVVVVLVYCSCIFHSFLLLAGENLVRLAAGGVCAGFFTFWSF